MRAAIAAAVLVGAIAPASADCPKRPPCGDDCVADVATATCRPKPRARALQVTIDSVPSGASLAIDGVVVGATPYRGAVRAGPHSIAIGPTGTHLKRTETVTFGPGATRHVGKLEPGTTLLVGIGEPTSFEVWIDGQYRMRMHEAGQVLVAPGVHQLTVRRRGYRSKTFPVTTKLGDPTMVVVELEPAPARTYPLATIGKTTQIALPEEIHFAADSSRLDGKTHALLDQVAPILAEMKDLSYQVEGHDDSRASYEAAQLMSQARADAVRAYLIARGLPADRVIAVGRGEDEPIDDNRTAAGRARNRRVEIWIAD